MTISTEFSKQYHGVGTDKLSFNCSITTRLRDGSDLQVPGRAPVSSRFQVTPSGISVDGNPESSGGYIQEVHVERIPCDPTASQASVGEGCAHTLYDPQDKSPLFKKLLPLSPDPAFRAPFTMDGTRVTQKRVDKGDAS